MPVPTNRAPGNSVSSADINALAVLANATEVDAAAALTPAEADAAYAPDVHSHVNSDVPGLAAVATSGNYADLTGAPPQETTRVYAVSGVYPAASASVRVREFFGQNPPGTGAGQAKNSDLWFKTATDFPAP